MVTMAPRMGGLPPMQPRMSPLDSAIALAQRLKGSGRISIDDIRQAQQMLLQRQQQTSPNQSDMMAQPVAYQNIPKLAQSFPRLIQMIRDAYTRMGRTPPSDEKLANIAQQMQARTAASPMGMSGTGVQGATRPAYEGQRFTGMTMPTNRGPHMRQGQVAGELPLETRDLKKLQGMQDFAGTDPGVMITSRPPQMGPLISADQAATMSQFPRGMVYGTQSVPQSMNTGLQKAIEAFTKRKGAPPSESEMAQIIRELSAMPQSALDMLSFPGAKAGAPNVAAQEVGALARAGESGALAELAKTAGKAAGVKGPAAEEALTRAILQRQATGPRKSSLDYLTALPTKQGKNLEALAEQMQKKKLLDEIKKLLKK